MALRRCRIAAWLLICVALPLRAEWVDGRVVSVHDGDTATLVTAAGRILRVRFYGVDAPERQTEDWPDQPYAADAADFSRRLLLERPVTVRLTGERTYRREVGEIFIDGKSATRELVRAGLGWWNARYARDDHDLERLEKAARRARRGLWRDAQAIPPWKFRGRYRRRAR